MIVYYREFGSEEFKKVECKNALVNPEDPKSMNITFVNAQDNIFGKVYDVREYWVENDDVCPPQYPPAHVIEKTEDL